MKKVLWLTILVLVSTLLISGCSTGPETVAPDSSGETGAETSVQGEQIILRFANYFPGESGPGKIGQEFTDDISRITDGRVKVEYYPGEMLLTVDKMYDGVNEGIADIGFSNINYTFGRFPITEVLDLPHGYPNAWVGGHVLRDFYKEFAPDEWGEIHLLTLVSSPVNNIITASTPVRNPDDMRGLILRGGGYIAKLVEALGGTARNVTMPQVYDNLAKGVIGGVLNPYETMQTFRFGEVSNYVTEIWPLGQVYTFYMVMNKKSWEQLPADIQEIISDYIENEYAERLSLMFNQIDIDGKQYAIDSGFEIIEIPEGELSYWKELSDKVIDEYIVKMVGSGHSEEEVRGWITFIRDRIDYWSEKQKELGIKSSTGPMEVLYQYD